MSDSSPEERPNCKQILDSMTQWILSDNEISKIKLFDNLEKRLENENQFFIDFMKYKKSNYLEKNISQNSISKSFLKYFKINN